MDEPHLLCLIPGLLSCNLLFCLHLPEGGEGQRVRACSGKQAGTAGEEMRDRRGFWTSHWVKGIRDIRDVREEGGGVRSWWWVVLRSPEDKDTGLGTLPSLRVWKDRDTWWVCPGDSRSQESKSPAALLPPPREAWTISILRPQPSPWAAAAVTSQAQLLHHHLTGPPSPSGEKACAQDLRMSPGDSVQTDGTVWSPTLVPGLPPEDALLAGAVFRCTHQHTVPPPCLLRRGPDPYGCAEAIQGHEAAWLGT